MSNEKNINDDYNVCRENSIEWIKGDKTVIATFSQTSFKNKIKKIAKKHPNEVKILAENEDGSLLASLPLKAIHISISQRQFTEEQRKEMRERLLRSNKT